MDESILRTVKWTIMSLDSACRARTITIEQPAVAVTAGIGEIPKYRIEGKVYDADRIGGGKVVARWASVAKVKTKKGPDYWHVEMRIPVRIVGREGAEGDPYNYVVAPELNSGEPWYFNMARRRKRATAENRRFKDITAVFAKSRPFHIRKFRDPDAFAKLQME